MRLISVESMSVQNVVELKLKKIKFQNYLHKHEFTVLFDVFI